MPTPAHLFLSFFSLFHFLDIHKLDEWQTLIESDFKSMEWFDSDSSDDEDDDDEDDEDDEEMDTD